MKIGFGERIIIIWYILGVYCMRNCERDVVVFFRLHLHGKREVGSSLGYSNLFQCLVFTIKCRISCLTFFLIFSIFRKIDLFENVTSVTTKRIFLLFYIKHPENCIEICLLNNSCKNSNKVLTF